MATYIVRRLLQALPTLLVISILIFTIFHLIPGDPQLQSLIKAGTICNLTCRTNLAHKYGLDRPGYIQYFTWLWGMLTLNWGYGLHNGIPVTSQIAGRLPATLLLMTTAFILSEIIAISSGIDAALRRYSFFDQFLTVFAYAGLSMPTFWFGLLLIMVFGSMLKILPVNGIVNLRTSPDFFSGAYFHYWTVHPLTAFSDLASHMILPVTVLAVVSIANDSRFMRSSMLDVMNQDYIRTAKAKGLRRRTVIYKHAVRNAILPIVTNVALSIPGLVGGAIITETIFSWPGMGLLYFQALGSNDYATILALLMITAILTLLCNILADVSYAWVDPRIRYD